MSNLVETVAEKLGYPPVLVERSANARAQAEGKDIEEVLSAWAGGESVSSDSSGVDEVSSETEESVETAEAQEGDSSPAAEEGTPDSAPPSTEEPPSQPTVPTPAPTPPSVPEPTPAPAPVQAPETTTFPVTNPALVPGVAAMTPAVAYGAPSFSIGGGMVAVSLRRRGQKAAWYGLVTGLLSGFFVILVTSAWLLPRAMLTGDQGAVSPAVEVPPGWVMLVLVIWGLVTGSVVAAVGRFGTGWLGSGWRLQGKWGWSIGFGALSGVVGGALVGVVAALAFSQESPAGEGWVVIPIMSGTIVVALGMAIVGAISAWLPQAIGVPEGSPAEDPEEMSKVRRLLSTAVAVPVFGVIVISLLVIPAAWLFLAFPSYAPLMAMLVAGGILGFASLSASRPGMKITWGEFLIAVSGIGVIVLIIISLLLVTGEDENEEEDHSPEETPAALEYFG